MSLYCYCYCQAQARSMPGQCRPLSPLRSETQYVQHVLTVFASLTLPVLVAATSTRGHVLCVQCSLHEIKTYALRFRHRDGIARWPSRSHLTPPPTRRAHANGICTQNSWWLPATYNFIFINCFPSNGNARRAGTCTQARTHTQIRVHRQAHSKWIVACTGGRSRYGTR